MPWQDANCVITLVTYREKSIFSRPQTQAYSKHAKIPKLLQEYDRQKDQVHVKTTLMHAQDQNTTRTSKIHKCVKRLTFFEILCVTLRICKEVNQIRIGRQFQICIIRPIGPFQCMNICKSPPTMLGVNSRVSTRAT